MCASAKPAFIRFTAFDQRTTPEFEAEVVRVAADLTREPEKGTAFYVVRLRLKNRPDGSQAIGDAGGVAEGKSEPLELSEKRGQGRKRAGFTLVPGMPADVHIRTGERTALSYFLKPLRDQFERAFSER